MNDVLTVRDLHTSFFTSMGEVKAVDGVSFSVKCRRTLGIVSLECFETGETGRRTS